MGAGGVAPVEVRGWKPKLPTHDEVKVRRAVHNGMDPKVPMLPKESTILQPPNGSAASGNKKTEDLKTSLYIIVCRKIAEMLA